MRALWILLGGLAIALGVVSVRWVLNRECGHGTPDAMTGGVRGASPDEQRATVRSTAAHASAPAALTSLPRPLRPGEPVPEASFVDQEGGEFRLSDLKGNVVVIAFIYTHCNVPSMCPLATAKLIEVQRLVKERWTSGVRFLLVSFDPQRDRPRRLREFAALYGPDLSTFTLASGEADQVASLSRALNTYYRQPQPGFFEHNIVVSLIDHEGVLRDDFFGTGWEAEELALAIEKLVETFPDVLGAQGKDR